MTGHRLGVTALSASGDEHVFSCSSDCTVIQWCAKKLEVCFVSFCFFFFLPHLLSFFFFFFFLFLSACGALPLSIRRASVVGAGGRELRCAWVPGHAAALLVARAAAVVRKEPAGSAGDYAGSWYGNMRIHGKRCSHMRLNPHSTQEDVLLLWAALRPQRRAGTHRTGNLPEPRLLAHVWQR